MGECVSTFTASIRIASDFNNKFVHHRPGKVKRNMYIPGLNLYFCEHWLFSDEMVAVGSCYVG